MAISQSPWKQSPQITINILLDDAIIVGLDQSIDNQVRF